MEENLTQILPRLEAIIFSEGGEVTIKTLLNLLDIPLENLTTLVQEFNSQKRGTVLVQDSHKVIMRVASEYVPLIEALRKDALAEEISKAGLEVLAIVLYSEAGAMSASEVEHIRGVKSGYILRQLTMRGLLSKSKKGMSYSYTPTAELLGFLGVMQRDSLPEIGKIQQQVREFVTQQETQDDSTNI